MDSKVGIAIGVVSILFAVIGISVSIDSDKESGKQRSVIQKDVEETKAIASEISEKLGRFRITIGGATTHAAEAQGNLDYQAYLQTPNAKIDLNKIGSYFTDSEKNEKSKLLKELTSQLARIESDYKKELRNLSTVEREIKRTEGILLSHRRQLGIIATAIKMTDPPPQIFAIANKVEVMLYETI